MNLFLTAAPAGNPGSMIFMLIAMFAILYFIMIRPENKRKKQAEEMRNSVKVGDKITTIGGVVGTVCHVSEDKIVVETSADRVRIEFAKWALGTNETAAEKAKAEAAKAAAERKKAKDAKKK